MTQATDIVKSIQEALEDIKRGQLQYPHSFEVYAEIKAENALSLIPSLLSELERVEKGVSLADCAMALQGNERIKLGSDLQQIAKVVLDKAGVKYHD